MTERRSGRSRLVARDGKIIIERRDHPWATFLDARLNVIEYLVAEGHGDEYIRQAINVDPMQLTLLKMTVDDRQKEGRA